MCMTAKSLARSIGIFIYIGCVTTAIKQHLSVKDNLKFWSRGEKKNLEHMIQQFELEDIMRVKVQKLSGGMKRRLAIACALLQLPPTKTVRLPGCGNIAR